MKVLAILFFATFLGTAGAQNCVEGDPSPGGFWLSRLELRGNELILTRSSEDLGFSFQEDGGSRAVASPPCSIVKLPLHRGARFFSRESSLVIMPSNGKDRRTLFVTEETNRKGDVHAGILVKSSRAGSRMVVDGVTYIGLIPSALDVTSQESLAAAVATITE